jgi:hypothetical protein
MNERKNPWEGWPDAKRDGMCEIPVVVARVLRRLLDEVTPAQLIEAGISGNERIEAEIYLDNALNREPTPAGVHELPKP